MPFTAFQPVHHAFRFFNQFANNVGIGPLSVKTQGRCGGMVYAALDYFHAGVRIPNRVDVPPDGDPVADFIMLRQVTSMVDMGPMFLTKLAQQAAPHIDLPLAGHVGPGLSSAEQFQSGVDYVDGVCIAVDAGQLIVLGLLPLEFDPNGNHQVLAIGYDHHADRARRRVHIYDPNHPAEVTTLTPDPHGKRFIDNFGKSWRTLFNDDSYEAMDPPRLATPTPAAGFAVSRIPDHLDLFWTGPDGAIGATVSNRARLVWRVSRLTRQAPQAPRRWCPALPERRIISTSSGWAATRRLAPRSGTACSTPVRGIRLSRSRLPRRLGKTRRSRRCRGSRTIWMSSGSVPMRHRQHFLERVDDGGRWHTPFPVTPAGAAGAGSGLSAIARLPHHIDLFWIGPDGAIATTFWDKDHNGGLWNTPVPITPPAAARPHAPVIAVARTPHHIDVFWIGPDGAIGSTFWNQALNGGRWNAPYPVSPGAAAGPASPLTAVARTPHHVDVFWLGGDGAIGTTFWNKDRNGGLWHQPFPVSPPGAARAGSPLTAVARTFQHLDVFWIGPDGCHWHDVLLASGKNGGWNMPFPITPPAAAG